MTSIKRLQPGCVSIDCLPGLSDFSDSGVKPILATRNVIIVGAGIGGLAAACSLSAQGWPVTVLERQGAPGGKMRQVVVDGRPIDAGPTVFTMRWVFDELFAALGQRLEDHISLRPAGILARHAWSQTEQLDLHADIEQSAAAIAAFAGPAESRGFLDFCRAASRTYQTLEQPFIKAPRPSMASLALSVRSPASLLTIKPFATLWSELARHFRDPRLRQLFGRYATYCGSSPFLAPATLMLVAHVEQMGVWFVEGGMHAVARALAQASGVEIRYGAEVAEIGLAAGTATGVRLVSGETLPAAAIILNADPAALAAGRFGSAVRHAIDAPKPADRSLSALTWTGTAQISGFPLSHHTVFFSRDYRAEFDQLAQGRVPAEPTTYVCAQDRDDSDRTPDGSERLLVLVNAPANGDVHRYEDSEVEQCRQTAWSLMQRCGLHLSQPTLTATSPTGFNHLFPGTGGALYGSAVHGATASFRRPGSRTRVPGLYLAGGATHPGAGVPMAALSGRLAASALMADLGSTGRSRPMAMSGGMSTR